MIHRMLFRTLLLGSSCGLAVAAEPGPLSKLESRLLDSETVEVEFEVTAAGAIDAKVTGSLKLKAGNVTTLTAAGTFAGKMVDLALKSDGTKLSTTGGRREFDGSSPEALNEAVLIGLTRMGILHNIALLTAGAPPDHAEGGVCEWVKAEAEKSGTAGGAGKGDEKHPTIAFNIVISGQPGGSATIHLDSGSLLPARRVQRVKFPQGEMRVTENYKVFKATPKTGKAKP